MDADDQHFLVVRAVEDPDAPALGEIAGVAPHEIVVELLGGRHLEREHLAALRIDAGHHVLDRAVLAGGVHRLEDEQQRPRVLSRRACPAARSATRRPAPAVPSPAASDPTRGHACRPGRQSFSRKRLPLGDAVRVDELVDRLEDLLSRHGVTSCACSVRSRCHSDRARILAPKFSRSSGSRRRRRALRADDGDARSRAGVCRSATARTVAQRPQRPPRRAPRRETTGSLSSAAASARSLRCASAACAGTSSTRKHETGLPSTAPNAIGAFVRTNAAAGRREPRHPRMRERDAVAQRRAAEASRVPRARPSPRAPTARGCVRRAPRRTRPTRRGRQRRRRARHPRRRESLPRRSRRRYSSLRSSSSDSASECCRVIVFAFSS